MPVRVLYVPTLLLIALASPCFGEEPTAEQLAFFESKVRPVFIEHCQKCHGVEKQWSGFRLDSRDAILKGGDNGAAVVPGQPEDSPLIRAIRQDEGEIAMPPKGKLTDAQIADLTEWVRQGAAFPAGRPGAGERNRDPNHWSFQPVVEPALPTVKNSAWVASGIDAFILAKLEAAGLEPTPAADKTTLIRRVTFDLTGLPPTPEEVASFLADERPDAYARLIDRLLETTAYGEHWGRHWLDVARYADSNGLDENIAHGNAWKYRNYVVDAINRDMPFNEFVIEQLAGDLLPSADTSEKYRRYIALGFLSVGPKVVAEPDPVRMRMDIIDEQLDTLGRAFLGMTFGCMRCHDHKFDPLATEDYYGMAGVLKSTKTMENFKIVARWHENPLPTPESEAEKAAHEKKVADQKAKLETVIASANKELEARLAAEAAKAAEAKSESKSEPESKPAPEAKPSESGEAKPEEKVEDKKVEDKPAEKPAEKPAALTPEQKEAMYPEPVKAELKTLREGLKQIEDAAPELPSAMGVAEDTVEDIPVHVRGSHLKLGAVVPRHVPAVMKGPVAPAFPTDKSGRLELARWLVDPAHPLTARVFVNRMWRWHFGRGIVASPDNFGLLGEKPTHPELLDWLALRFIEKGWSLKALHREILLSSTWRQGSHPTDKAVEVDPENMLWSRFPVRRLEAEQVRDAILAVSGQLDRTPGGAVLTVKNRGYLFDHTSKDLTSYASTRRSVYLPVIRNNVYDVFQLLDYPDAAVSSGDRVTTTVSPQALMWLNSELVLQASEKLQERLAKESSADDSTRIAQMIRLAYGREPVASEVDRLLVTLRDLEAVYRVAPPVAAPVETAAATTGGGEAGTASADGSAAAVDAATAAEKVRLAAWTALCQITLAANEFIYIN